jgi:hypothetical protein
MIASTISRIIVRASRWSSTGNAAARPDRGPATPMSLRASPRYCATTAHQSRSAYSVARTSRFNRFSPNAAPH